MSEPTELSLPYTRVYQDKGHWYWMAIDSYGRDATGVVHGPFESAVEAGRSARNDIIEREKP